MDFEKYRERLKAKASEVSAILERASISFREEPKNDGLDMADESAQSQQKDLLLTQADFNTKLLSDIRSALQRIEEGTYGLCLEDGEEIASARLEAIPWAKYCVEHQAIVDEQSLTAA